MALPPRLNLIVEITIKDPTPAPQIRQVSRRHYAPHKLTYLLLQEADNG